VLFKFTCDEISYEEDVFYEEVFSQEQSKQASEVLKI
jgi:hypothetical protein